MEEKNADEEEKTEIGGDQRTLSKKADPEKFNEIKEQLEADKEAAFAARRKKIAVLAEAYKNDPVKIALLNKAAKELAMLEK